MWKLEHRDRPIQSPTANDNLCLSTVIKAQEVGGDIPQTIFLFPFQKKSLIKAVEDMPRRNNSTIRQLYLGHLKTTSGALISFGEMI